MSRKLLYREEFCEMLVDHMKKGYSFTSFAAVVDVNRKTLHEWVKKYPEFEEAKDRATAHCLFYWEKMGIALAGGKLNGNVTSWIFNMKNRFNWDNVENENNVTVNNNVQLDDEKMKKLILIARGKNGINPDKK